MVVPELVAPLAGEEEEREEKRMDCSTVSAPVEDDEGGRDSLVVTERRFVRRDWCKSQPLIQTLREEGCLSRTVVNRFCHGQCNSFYIPGGAGGQGEEPFRSCAFCKPRLLSTVTVGFLCPGRSPPAKRRRLTLVKECRCTSIELH
ncbi:gremlin-1-like [Huso huso]|uniref:Gremlin-1 n=1 Tax=Huso huso TaxID=61971 RepID=A0ABR0ZSJ4_HUSHU